MLIIALTGRAIMNKLSFFTRHAVAMRKAFGIIILLAVAFIASGGDAVALFSKDEKPLQTTENTGLQDALEKPYPAPEIKGIHAWLNSDPLTLESLKGKVVLIDFWTYSCINCVRTLPYLTQWDETYRDDGHPCAGIRL
jgi:thiol-disulfide isomerase/thioredoxin